MRTERFYFDQFTLDVGDRQLLRDDEAIELNSRYLDALALLVSEHGRLVPKERFLSEVWRGVPVTDEALTQCVKTLRKRLGDDAVNPRFIETVPKHGYRFVASVRKIEPGSFSSAVPRFDPRSAVAIGVAGTLGGAFAGFLGGLFYGFAGASDPFERAIGAVSEVLVLLSITTLVALLGGFGVASGIALASLSGRRSWIIGGAAIGGLVVGGIVKLLALDAFTLLIGRSPGAITGPLEGMILGAAIGAGVALATGDSAFRSRRRAALIAAAAGALAGILIIGLGGRLMGGSLNSLEHSFPASRLRIDRIGTWFGERTFGNTAQMVTAALEGSLFAGCVVGAISIVYRKLDSRRS